MYTHMIIYTHIFVHAITCSYTMNEHIKFYTYTSMSTTHIHMSTHSSIHSQVLFNLANQYEANEMYSEALNTYLLIVKNKMFSNGGRLRVNMGNIYTAQKKYPQAIKMYRMALDQIGELHKSVRLKILQNIGSVFIKMGQYADAITSFEHIMSDRPDFKTGR